MSVDSATVVELTRNLIRINESAPWPGATMCDKECVGGTIMLDASAQGFRLARNVDRFGERRDLGIGVLSIKVSTEDNGWALVGDHAGRLACTVTPAGQLEAFFRQLSKIGAMAPQDRAFWIPYGLELIGPPVDI
jgi:hypothetical protein